MRRTMVTPIYTSRTPEELAAAVKEILMILERELAEYDE